MLIGCLQKSRTKVRIYAHSGKSEALKGEKWEIEGGGETNDIQSGKIFLIDRDRRRGAHVPGWLAGRTAEVQPKWFCEKRQPSICINEAWRTRCSDWEILIQFGWKCFFEIEKSFGKI